MMADVPLDTAVLAGLISGCILYGVFLALFATSLYVLVHKRSTPRPNLFLLSGSVILFANATGSQALGICRTMEAFVMYRESIGVISYLESGALWMLSTRDVLLGLNLVTADCILLYRCWIVWRGKRWMLALPILLYLATFATMFFDMSLLIRTPKVIAPPNAFIDYPNSALMSACISLTIVQNIIAIGLLVWRVWRVDIAANQYLRIHPVIPLLAGAGALYVATLLILLITFLLHTNAWYVLLDITNQVIGIAFSILIVKVGLGSSRRSQELPSAAKRYSRFPPPTNAVLFKRDIDSGDPVVDGPAPAELSLCKMDSHPAVTECPEEGRR